VAISVTGDPSDYWSRALGFGFDRPVTEELLGEVIDFYRTAGARVMNLVLAPEVVPADWPGIRQRLGLVEQDGTGVKLARDDSPAKPAETTLRVGLIDPSEVGEWVAVQMDVFQLPDAGGGMAAMFAGVYDVPGVTCHGAWDGDKLVATGGLYVADGAAQFFSAATIAEYRGRGAQSALLTDRIEGALAAGAKVLAVDVAKPAPGEQNPSLNNAVRAGFKALYDRPTYVWRA
jgi:GNAT superfamily N-acetyltransferase